MTQGSRGASLQEPRVRDGLFIGSLTNLIDVSLTGTRCAACAETSLGCVELCPNCGSEQVERLRLGDSGIWWTYAVARHKPPGHYRGPEPIKRFCIGMVELAEGICFMSTLECDLEQWGV